MEGNDWIAHYEPEVFVTQVDEATIPFDEPSELEYSEAAVEEKERQHSRCP